MDGTLNSDFLGQDLSSPTERNRLRFLGIYRPTTYFDQPKIYC